MTQRLQCWSEAQPTHEEKNQAQAQAQAQLNSGPVSALVPPCQPCELGHLNRTGYSASSMATCECGEKWLYLDITNFGGSFKCSIRKLTRESWPEWEMKVLGKTDGKGGEGQHPCTWLLEAEAEVDLASGCGKFGRTLKMKVCVNSVQAWMLLRGLQQSYWTYQSASLSYLVMRAEWSNVEKNYFSVFKQCWVKVYIVGIGRFKNRTPFHPQCLLTKCLLA